MLGVHHSDVNKIMAGGVSDQISRDGGVTWSNTFSGTHSDKHIVVSIPGTNYFLQGNDGGVWKKIRLRRSCSR